MAKKRRRKSSKWIDSFEKRLIAGVFLAFIIGGIAFTIRDILQQLLTDIFANFGITNPLTLSFIFLGFLVAVGLIILKMYKIRTTG